jgi:hypothetical protein
MKVKLSAILLTLTLANFANSQDFKGLSVTPKIGLSDFNETTFSGAGIDANYLINNWSYSIGYLGLDEWGLIGSTTPLENYKQIHFGVGQYCDIGVLRIDYQLGGAVINGIKRTTVNTNPKSIYDDYYNRENFTTFGLSVKGGINFVLLPVMSVGIDLHVNVNSKTPIYMPMISLEIGKLRTAK